MGGERMERANGADEERETLLRVARVPEDAPTTHALRWAVVSLTPEEGRGRYALYLLDLEGIPLEVDFAETLEDAQARARAIARPLAWGECSIRTSGRKRIDPHLFEACLPG